VDPAARTEGTIMTLDQFLDQLREELERRLAVKTGWGRNEVLVAFDKASITVLSAALSSQEQS
jgi:hypothetical protein